MRIDADTLREMATLLSTEDRDEMAIPSFLHRNPALRWMAWRRVEVVARELGQIVRREGRSSTSAAAPGCCSKPRWPARAR